MKYGAKLYRYGWVKCGARFGDLKVCVLLDVSRV